MNSRAITIVAGSSLSLVLLAAFQNCSETGFQAKQHDSFSSSLQLSPLLTADMTIQASAASKLEATQDMTFEFYADNYAVTDLQWSHTFNGVSKGCAEKNAATGADYMLNCPTAGSLIISLTGVAEGRTISIPVYNAVIAIAAPASVPGGAAPEINMAMVFEIAAGTANKAWNTAAAPVEVFVGQTLQLKNSDAVVHRLHTGGRPFPHGANIAVAASATYRIAQSYARAANGDLYDHIANRPAFFFVVAHDGAQLYSQNCAGCHGALAASAKLSARVSQIKGGIANVPSMRISALAGLSQRQIEAISYALGGR